MGLGGMGIWELLLILAIVVMLFGTKRLGSLGPDLGNAIRGFRKAMQPGEEEVNRPEVTRQAAASQAMDASVERVEQQR